MNITEWKHYHRADKYKTGAIYEPLVSPCGSILCMRFDPNNTYREKSVSEELAEDCFQREIKYLKKFKNYDWCANLLDYDQSKREVYIEWNNYCCESLIVLGYDLSSFSKTWKNQLSKIIKDLKDNEVYKITMYPCYHFFKNQKLKAFGFYTTCDYQEQPINIDLYRPIFNESRANYINSMWPDGMVDFSILNKHSLTEYIKWPEDPLPSIYKEIYND